LKFRRQASSAPRHISGQGEELARHGARKRVLRHSAALRADRTRAHEDL